MNHDVVGAHIPLAGQTLDYFAVPNTVLTNYRWPFGNCRFSKCVEKVKYRKISFTRAYLVIMLYAGQNHPNLSCRNKVRCCKAPTNQTDGRHSLDVPGNTSERRLTNWNPRYMSELCGDSLQVADNDTVILHPSIPGRFTSHGRALWCILTPWCIIRPMTCVITTTTAQQ